MTIPASAGLSYPTRNSELVHACMPASAVLVMDEPAAMGIVAGVVPHARRMHSRLGVYGA